MSNERIARARLALEGLSVGDAFGEQLLHAGPQSRAIAISERQAPSAKVWRWTDDTAMALSIVDVLAAHGAIDEAALAAAFAERYVREPARGYGGGAHQILGALAAGVPYRSAARLVFDGEGSCGNGGGMRSAPIGAYFADDLARVVEHAAHSAAPTHAHPDGVAGAIAIAVAAALATRGERDPARLIAGVAEHTPPGPTRDGLARAQKLVGGDAMLAAVSLGNGSRVISSDTIPFAVWCGAHHLTDYAEALWTCGMVGGDVDTTCAMVGGIVVGAVGLVGIPETWRSAREPLRG